MIEAAVQALLGFSQIECVRPFFALSLPLTVSILRETSLTNIRNKSQIEDGGDDDGNHGRKRKEEGKSRNENKSEFESENEDRGSEMTDNMTAIHVVLSLIKSRPHIAGNSIGLLMNACLDAPISSPSSSPSSSSASSSSSFSSSSSSSPSLPISVNGGQNPMLGSTVKEVVVAAGGVDLGLTGIFLGSNERMNFFEKEGPQGEKIKL